MRRLLTLLVLTGACTEFSAEGRSLEVLNGIPAPNDVSVVALTSRATGRFNCSGALIAERIVLTAAHCLPPHINPASGVLAMTDVVVYFGEEVGGPEPLIGVEAGRAHLSWQVGALPNDVGILYLESEAPVPPMPFNTERLEDLELFGALVRIVGYGRTQADVSDSGVRRQGQMVLESADATNTFSRALPGASCPGDSGGALLAMINGVETLVGITSRGGCGDVSIHERVDAHVSDFIDPFIANPFDASCDADLQCALGCDEPDPDCPCASDGFCDEACDNIASDDDCAETCALLDGVCGEGCEFADLDCRCADDGVCSELACLEIDPDCTEDSGCGCQGGPGGSSLPMLIFFALLFRRRALCAITQAR